MSDTVPSSPQPPGDTAPDTIQRARPSTRYHLVLTAVVIVAIVIAAIVALHVVDSRVPSSDGACTSGETISGAGSTFVAPLMDQWATAYTNNTVDYDAVGSGTGVEDLQALAVEYGASDAPLTPFQTSQFTHPVLTMPEAAGAIAIIYNVPGLTAPLNVNATFLVYVYEGWITNWDSAMLRTLNPGVSLPNATITPVHRSDGSGTTYVVTQWMSLANPTFSSQVGYATTVSWPLVSGEEAEKGSSGIAGYVSQTPDTLGYVDLTYAITNSITFAAVQNPSKTFVLPSLNDTASAIADVLAEPGFTLPSGDGNWSAVNVLNAPGAADYPLATFTYVMFYEQPDKAWIGGQVTEADVEGLQNFLTWIIHKGQSYSASLEYVPLPAKVVSLDETTLGMVDWSGSPLPTCS